MLFKLKYLDIRHNIDTLYRADCIIPITSYFYLYNTNYILQLSIIRLHNILYTYSLLIYIYIYIYIYIFTLIYNVETLSTKLYYMFLYLI